MARKARSGRRPRRRRTRRSRRYSLRRRVAGLSRKLAAEVKKNDNAQLITANEFEQLTNQNLYDYAYLYPIFDATMQQGTQLDDIIGESIRIKYIYLGLHLQQAAYTSSSANSLPVCLRVLLVQDRNYRSYANGVPTASQMFQNLFGYQVSATNPYQGQIDCTLLPYTPLEPGRFRIIRDFQMKTSPGWKADYYRKFTVLQRSLNSKGRVYFGPSYPQPIGVVQQSPSLGNGKYYIAWANGNANVPAGVPVSQVDSSSAEGYTFVIGSGSAPYQITQQAYDTEAAALNAYKEYLEAQPTAAEATDTNVSYTTSRNGLYLLILRQGSPLQQQTTQPSFSLSLQSRLAYYDN